jgi:hypothetical protein
VASAMAASPGFDPVPAATSSTIHVQVAQAFSTFEHAVPFTCMKIDTYGMYTPRRTPLAGKFVRPRSGAYGSFCRSSESKVPVRVGGGTRVPE